MGRCWVIETVFIVGGSGFVGSHVVRALVRAGHRVFGLGRSISSCERLRELGAEPVMGDLRQSGGWCESLRSATVIVDTHQVRPEGRLTIGAARAALAGRIANTEGLLSAIRHECQSLSAYILLGGVDDYQVPCDGGWVDEETLLAEHPIGFARIGVPLNRVFTAARAEWGLPLVDLHAGLIYGPGGWFQTGFVDGMRTGRYALFGKADNLLSLVHVDDVAQAVAAAVAQRPVGGRINIVDDEPVRQYDFAAETAAVFGLRRPWLRVPGWVGAMVAGRVAIETLTNSLQVSNARLKGLLGVQLKYPTYREGLRATAGSLANR